MKKYNNLCFGSHISTSKGVIQSITRAKEIGCDIVQIFSQSPRNLKGPSQKMVDLAPYIVHKLEEYSIKIVSHSPYLINLAKHPKKYFYMVECLLKDLCFINSIGGIGSVVHMGKSVGLSIEDALYYMETNIKRILGQYNGKAKLILETSCGQGTELLYKLSDLETFYNRFSDDEKDKIAFCVDTCHIFVAGNDLRSQSNVVDYFEDFKSKFGLHKLVLIHLNDSATAFDSRRDRHANIGAGYIGDSEKGGNIEGIKKIVELADAYSIPMVLETPDKDIYVEYIKNGNWKSIQNINKS